MFSFLTINLIQFESIYTYSRVSKRFLSFQIDKYDGYSMLILDNTIVKNSIFINFGFIYSTIKVQIFNATFSLNDF